MKKLLKVLGIILLLLVAVTGIYYFSKICFAVSLLFGFNMSFAQTEEADSLIQALSLAQENVQRISLMNELSSNVFHEYIFEYDCIYLC